jgi:hypothetical protein
MIHYHGTPITPETAAAAIMKGRHAMVSFANPQQIELFLECCQSVSADNGAFPLWKAGEKVVSWDPYYAWVSYLMRHPCFDWALIPDIIDGSEDDNNALISAWPLGSTYGVPVWHLHESLEKLRILCEQWPRVAIGSSGEYANIGTDRWWHRMSEAMDVACPNGYPICKLHGLRMLDPFVYSRFPFSSADSTNVARNIGIDAAWKGPYSPANKAGRGVVLADRIESFNSAPSWSGMETQSALPFATLCNMAEQS